MSDNDFDSTEFDNTDFDGDDRLRALLRGGDPAGSLSPADPAALSSLLEDIMSSDLDVRPSEPLATVPRRRTGATWLVAAAAVGVIAAGGAFAVAGLTGNDANMPQAGPQTTTNTPDDNVGVAGIAGQTTQLKAGTPAPKCAALTPAILAQYDQAFQGTVTSVEGNTVTFQTTDVYTGELGETVELTAPPAGLAKILGQSTTFQVGQDYLVTAYQGGVSMCGYSGPATTDLQRVFKEAFVH